MSEEKQPSSRDADEELKVVYQEVCSSFHAIADFRAKLLGFLPLASGAGIFLLLNRSLTDGTEQYLLPIGVFGFAVTLGLFFYELRGIQKCNSLVTGGKNIEELLGIHGQFRLIPPPINGFIRNTLASYVIYPAVLAAWTFVALVNIVGLWAYVPALFILGVGFGASFRLDLEVEIKEEPNKSRVLAKMLTIIDPNLQTDPKVVASVKELTERLGRLSQENHAPTQKEWQKLYELTKNW
jgi:hypothetical protein